MPGSGKPANPSPTGAIAHSPYVLRIRPMCPDSSPRPLLVPNHRRCELLADSLARVPKGPRPLHDNSGIELRKVDSPAFLANRREKTRHLVEVGDGKHGYCHCACEDQCMQSHGKHHVHLAENPLNLLRRVGTSNHRDLVRPRHPPHEDQSRSLKVVVEPRRLRRAPAPHGRSVRNQGVGEAAHLRLRAEPAF